LIPNVCGVILLRRDGAALLRHRDDKPGLRHAGMWVPPGGHAVLGESKHDCARRELREETDHFTSDLRLLTSFTDKIEGGPP